MDDMTNSPEDYTDSDGNQRLLMDTLEGIDHTEEFKSVLVDSMESTRLVMNTEASSLILIDEETGEMYVSMPTGPVKMTVAGKSIPQSKGIAGWVAENKRPYMTNDVSKSEHFYGELAEGFKTRNIICVPLINRENRVIGVMQALNRRNGEDFTSKDIPVFQSLASHFTLAIERSRMIDTLHDRLNQKDAIIAEIHHRIKNNLQIISALIETELPEINDKHAETVLQGISLRIQSMSRLHDMLSEKNLSNAVDLKDYLTKLSEKIRDTMSSFLYDVQIELDSEEIIVKQEQALLCGLILNELLINIYKHAFSGDDEEAKIQISLYRSDRNVFLRVSDNGVGLPDDFKLRKKDSIGMWIVDTLLKKLRADMEVGSEEGTRFEISFKA
ncbi:MAG: histidine kinase dimerization/phosphoacceptor domain -containing protein [Balneolaceae bacterium]|nr:histidine kinase dimerization/phosphoacceptor domain -containing protein [Balneolaceae bacterium]